MPSIWQEIWIYRISVWFSVMIASDISIFLLWLQGALRLVEKILATLMDYQDKHAPEEKFELVM